MIGSLMSAVTIAIERDALKARNKEKNDGAKAEWMPCTKEVTDE